MTTPQTLLSNLAKPAQAFSKAEQKVADAILANPELTTRSSIARLAQSAEVSEPTVNRFCKRLGATGFPDFKLKLALSLASGARFINSAVAEDDTAPTFTPKIFNASIHALEKTRDSIDPKLIHHVIDEVVASKRIYFFGQGNSGPVAQDAEFKFFRFNTPVSAHQDPLMQRMLAAASKPGDLLFIISYTGRTIGLVETARLARDSLATVISITAPASPLARASDLAITLDVGEDNGAARYTRPTSSASSTRSTNSTSSTISTRSPKLAKSTSATRPTKLPS